MKNKNLKFLVSAMELALGKDNLLNKWYRKIGYS
jgi:hypothetical protein